MAATTITRTTWTNDSGTPASPVGDGTIINNARLQDIYAAIDAVLAANITFGGLVSAEGFGTHSFSAAGTGANLVRVRNTSAGTGNYAGLSVGNDAAANLGTVWGFSSTYTTSASYYAGGVTIESTGSGGLNLNASDPSGPFRLFTGNTQRLAIDSAGLMTPLNSLKIAAGFLAYNSATDTSVANNTTIDFDTEVFDEAGNFSADTFTAPVAGRYLLSACVVLTNTSGGAITMQAVIVPSNHSTGLNIGYRSNVANNDSVAFSGSLVVDMDASDTAVVKYYGGGACSVLGDATQRYSWFSGRLVL